MKSARLASKESLLRKVDDELKILKNTQSVQAKRITELIKERDKLENEIKAQNLEVTISDHALVRYIERAYKLNIEGLKNEIIKSVVPEHIIALGGNGKHTYNGVTFVLQNYKIVTIYKA